MSEPMSAERLSVIRKRAVRAACRKHKDDGWLFCRIDAPELLAEVERLRASKDMEHGMYFEACEDRRTMGQEIERLCAENARLTTENEVLRRIIATMNREPETYAANGLRVKVENGRVTVEYEGGEQDG